MGKTLLVMAKVTVMAEGALLKRSTRDVISFGKIGTPFRFAPLLDGIPGGDQ
jgi:hypothetical protein